MPESSDPGRDWRVEAVPKDEKGRKMVLEKYKPFRLTALRVDPASFSSTLAREEAFEDEAWVSRLMSPQNRLIVATDDSNHDVVCAAFLRELPPAEPENSNVQVNSRSLTYGIFGLWTLPSARRKGIAFEVLKEAKRLAAQDAHMKGHECCLQVEAYEDNVNAVNLYKKAGFVVCPGLNNGSVKLSLALRSD